MSDYKTDTVKSFIEWTGTENESRCRKIILVTRKVQTVFLGSTGSECQQRGCTRRGAGSSSDERIRQQKGLFHV